MEIDSGMLKQIDSIPLSKRLENERAEFFAHEVEITSDRAVLVMESWKETEGEILDVRWARLVQKLAERTPIVIFKDQLLAGSETKLFRGADPWVEYEAPNLPEVMDSVKREVTTSAARVSQCADEEWAALEETIHFFLGKTPVDLIFANMKFLYGEWPEEMEKVRGILRQGRYNNVAPVPDWEKLLGQGLVSIIAEAREGIEKVRSGEEADVKKAGFWRAAIICCEAVVHYAERYARLARDMARSENEAKRRGELELIAESCERVPRLPARTLREAIQARVLWGIAMKWCRPNIVADETGRIDQYLYPYFKADLGAGRLSLDGAAELIGALASNLSRRDGVRSRQRGQLGQGTLLSNVVLGGLTKEGGDATNELTYLVLHMAGLLRYAEPHYTFRVNDKTPKSALVKALDTNRRVGGGQPQFMSDNRIIDYFVKQGEDLEDARDWMAFACMNPVPGGRHGSRVALRQVGDPNMPLMVDMALHDGVASMTGSQLGVKTGDASKFTTFEELWQAYRKQMDFIVTRMNAMVHAAHQVDLERTRFPLWSVLAPGCMEKGQDYLAGGLWGYRTWDWKDRGHVDSGDSLMAIKKLVFEDKKLTMAELVDALDSNFAGSKGESIRQMCLAAPKYGNGDPVPDNMVRESGKMMAEAIHQHKNPMGGPYSIERHGLSWHYYGGKGVGALPNGRKAGEPLNDGSLSPMRGTDRNGITAVLRSALNAEFKESRASVLNQRFPVSLMQSEGSTEKLADITKTFLTAGGTHIQYNILDRQVLLDARKHPEQYRDLVVRVAGYSAYWVHLTPEIQDDIISRTEQEI
ncbi:MAG: hypothetical protein HYX90_07435 [Chloroflexi bacterium]|nr:hypothetical protein [Chloroflexota bacterium]